MSDLFTITLIQADLHWEAPDKNYQALGQKLANLAKADLVLLPEMFGTGFSMHPEGLAESPEGPGYQFMAREAARLQAAICGSLIIEEGGLYYNRLYFVLPSGRYHCYNKRHRFSLAGEEKVYAPGDQKKLIVEWRGWRINPQICYDLRFPAWCRNQEDFDLQLFVANWPERRVMAWSALLQARAIENMVYVAGLNRVGEDGNGVYHSGHSAVYNPLGESIASIPSGEQGCTTVCLEKAALQRYREKLGFLKDRDQFSLHP